MSCNFSLSSPVRPLLYCIDTGLAHLSDAQPDFIYGLYINAMQFLLPCPPPPLLTHKVTKVYSIYLMPRQPLHLHPRVTKPLHKPFSLLGAFYHCEATLSKCLIPEFQH